MLGADGSPESILAAHTAFAEADRHGVGVIVGQVTKLPMVASANLLPARDDFELMEGDAQAVAEETVAAARAAYPNVPVEIVAKAGDPAYERADIAAHLCEARAEPLRIADPWLAAGAALRADPSPTAAAHRAAARCSDDAARGEWARSTGPPPPSGRPARPPAEPARALPDGARRAPTRGGRGRRR